MVLGHDGGEGLIHRVHRDYEPRGRIFSWVQQASRRKTALGRPAVSRSGIPAGSSAPPALGIAGRPCERALNECGEDCESLGASRLAHFGSVPSSVDERTLKGILLLLACCTQEESMGGFSSIRGLTGWRKFETCPDWGAKFLNPAQTQLSPFLFYSFPGDSWVW